MQLLKSLPHDPLSTAAQPSLGYAFYDMAVLVQALLTGTTNLNKMQKHRSMNTMFLLSLLCFWLKGLMKLKFGFKHLHHYE